MSTLNGRLARLEALFEPPPGPETCRGCGLRHVRPMTIDLLRGVLRIEGGSGRPLRARRPLCLCACCTDDPGDRWLARLSHGLPDEESAA